MIITTRHTAAALLILCTISLILPATSAGEVINTVTVAPVPAGGKPVAAKADAEGTIHLLYNTQDGPRYARSADNGETFSVVIPVVDKGSQKPGLEFHAWDMAVGKQGRIHVAMSTNGWRLKLPQSEWAFHYASLEPGAQAFAPVRNINHKPSEGFSLAADDKGNVTACWLSDKLYANVSKDDGKTFAPAIEIGAEYDPCDCCTTSAVYAADGKLAVLYREETNDQRDMFLVLWDQAQGKVSRTRVSTTLWKIKSCPMSYYTICRTHDGFVAVWPTEKQIYFARLDPQGNLLPPTEIETAGKAGHRTGMLALSAPKGRTLVAWSKDNQLGWQLYDAKGRAFGSGGSVPSSGDGVAGVVNKDGQFILFR